MAAERSGECLFEAIDHLWFHNTVIFKENTSVPTSQTPISSSKNITQTSAAATSSMACSQVESKRQESRESDEDKARRLSPHLASRKTRYHSSSPTSILKKESRLRQRSASCKSMEDLELQELKGFMDLGFVFKKHNLSSHVMSSSPGLQRIYDCEFQEEDGEEELGGKLMEFPFIVSLRMSGACNDSEKVKKHLKDWARTVAATIYQES